MRCRRYRCRRISVADHDTKKSNLRWDLRGGDTLYGFVRHARVFRRPRFPHGLNTGRNRVPTCVTDGHTHR